jgi:organic hydroperoxide reductase OsmC/OhrA
MSAREHRYSVTISWTGDRGTGTSGYRAYDRDHEIAASGKSPIAGSSDPAFRGDGTRWNPEELFVASLSACHQLWYLHLASASGIIVTSYVDRAEGFMEESADGGGRFTKVVLHPDVTIANRERTAEAHALHERAHELCFLANSVRFPVEVAELAHDEVLHREDDRENDEHRARGTFGDIAVT